MQCSILERTCNSGNLKMKNINIYQNPYRKESNLDNIVDQLCTRLQDIKDQEVVSNVGMPTCPVEQTEAVRRYYAAFPALNKGQESPLQYYLPPPAWCRKTSPDIKIKMQSEQLMSKDWNYNKSKKFSSGKERRNSYHAQRKNKKRNNSYSRSFESKEILPEWMTHEGIWEMETQDSVKEFIRALAADEGYGTCENTVTDEIKEVTQIEYRARENLVPDWDDGLDLDADWIIAENLKPKKPSPTEEELYAKFEAKFDRSIEALWSKDQNTPDDEYQELPIDFQDLLSSPSDRLLPEPFNEKCSFTSLTNSIWSRGADGRRAPTVERGGSPARLVERLGPLRLVDREPESASVSPPVDSDHDMYDALATVTHSMCSLAALNHSRETSAFAEVPPRCRPRLDIGYARTLSPAVVVRGVSAFEREDLISSSKTHFRPIRRETEPEPPRYADGDTFEIRGDLDTVELKRSESGALYLESSGERYLEYHRSRCEASGEGGLRMRFAVRQRDVAVQTERPPPAAAWSCDECGGAAKKMRPSGMGGIWGEARVCGSCRAAFAAHTQPPHPPRADEELSRDWEELLRDISAAHALYLGGASSPGDALEEALRGADRKRRHSAARPPLANAMCSHPHARFLHCCALALDRPLTR